jgi:Secretion system C-terminal sorting domain
MKPTLLLTVMFVAACAFSRPAMANPGKVYTRYSDSLEMKKLIVKRDAVRLSPNPTFDGKVSVVSQIPDAVHFYIFDLDGTMVYQATLKNKEEKKIDNLAKGTYTYDVFQNDESIEEGKIIVK